MNSAPENLSQGFGQSWMMSLEVHFCPAQWMVLDEANQDTAREPFSLLEL